jgi:hypothetical protein
MILQGAYHDARFGPPHPQRLVWAILFLLTSIVGSGSLRGFILVFFFFIINGLGSPGGDAHHRISQPS